ncbi:Casein kinase I isoform alpha [Mycena indigotica]|uniref:non-specific serine/threonine protein kinase n=1 Tax=Mycena indigotica TaxID=2126181 RepID=A0A8H6S4I9_9AGAR|nr:Casein kinase I isoform alpha [Mycena indigotica]KAF7293015.1 Casein kinase I isoform alpha [Mycena indigotica]
MLSLTVSSNPSEVKLQLGQPLGHGSYSSVFKGYRLSARGVVAVKKSRVSLRVKRPFLLHEARILQMLQGHRGIAHMMGYYRGPHFEYIAMELLGCTIKAKPGSLSNLCVLFILVADFSGPIAQQFSALEYIHSKGFVHRDIKPANILLSLTDPATICLVDFGISLPTDAPILPKRSSPSASTPEYPIGTLDWCSLNAHDGHVLGPSDDLESTIYALLFLLGGSVPWRIPEYYQPPSVSIVRVHDSKRQFVGSSLEAADSVLARQLGKILDDVRRLEVPSHAQLVNLLIAASECTLELDKQLPLDWTPCSPPPILKQLLEHPPKPKMVVEDEEDSEEIPESPQENTGLSDSSCRSSSDSDHTGSAIVYSSLFTRRSTASLDVDSEGGPRYPDSNHSDLEYTWFPLYNRDLSLTLPEIQAKICDAALPTCYVAPGHLKFGYEPVYSETDQMWPFERIENR